jgi:hypothetical protein
MPTGWATPVFRKPTVTTDPLWRPRGMWEDNFQTNLTLQRRSVSVLYNESVRTALKTLSTSVIKTSLLMFYKAKVAVCSETRTKHINAMWAPRRIFEC